jgi:hypothetical protein
MQDVRLPTKQPSGLVPPESEEQLCKVKRLPDYFDTAVSSISTRAAFRFRVGFRKQLNDISARSAGLAQQFRQLEVNSLALATEPFSMSRISLGWR